ncbi:hypothetical protein, partial [Burkholderia territorii]|uniref:hypothetical protein n=1 Tax=Burkholderia territorii TaxID=1503055 RepID=UPI001E51B720
LGFRFARHKLSLGACYALNTKFLTGPARLAQRRQVHMGVQQRAQWGNGLSVIGSKRPRRDRFKSQSGHACCTAMQFDACSC